MQNKSSRGTGALALAFALKAVLSMGAVIVCLLLPWRFGPEPVTAAESTNRSPFAVEPYIQIGESDAAASSAKNLALSVCFVVCDRAEYKLEYRQGQSSESKAAKLDVGPLYTRGNLRFVCTTLTALKPDEDVSYRVLRDGQAIFEAVTKAPPSKDSETRVALLGDLGSARAMGPLVSRLAAEKPDFIMFTGDLLPVAGTVAQYLDNFFPAFISSTGAAGENLLSRVPSAACPGDRDISADRYEPEHDNRKLDENEGGMAYFCFWKQPLNGPGKPGGKNLPQVTGAPGRVDEFKSSAGKAYPAMADYSYDWGDSHWLVLDGGAYMDWRDEQWRKWVADDLAASKKLWKFIVFHQPGFSSDTNHGEEQRMRLLCDLFEQAGVDMVFSGHSNSYQCSRPFHFALVAEDQEADRESKLGFVYGKFKFDRVFDGVAKTHPDGIIYVVSGDAGGEPVAELRIQEDPTRWQPFTRKFYCAAKSFSFLDIKGRELTFRQIAEDGKVLDQLKITK